MIDIIKEYLAAVGFEIDKKSFEDVQKTLADFEKAFENVGQKVNQAVQGSEQSFKKFSETVKKQSEEISKAVGTSLTVVNKQLSSFNENLNRTGMARLGGGGGGNPPRLPGIAGQPDEGGAPLWLTVLLDPIVIALAGIAALLGKMQQDLGKWMNQLAKSDMETQIFARRLFTATENARSLKAVMSAMGLEDLEQLKDVALNPELRGQFMELRKLSQGMDLDPIAQQGLKDIRALNFEFAKLRLSMEYFFANLAGHLSRFLQVGLMAKLIQMFEKLGGIVLKVLPDLGSFFKTTGAVLNWLLQILETSVDIVNSGLDAFSGFLDMGKQGDKYGQQANTFESLSEYVRRIFDLLNSIWNYISGLLRPLQKFASDPLGTVAKGAADLGKSITNLITPAANAAMNGHLSIQKGIGPISQAGQAWMNALGPLSSDFQVSSSMRGGHAPGSRHYRGLALDVGAAGKSIPQLADFIQSALANPRTQGLNLEFKPAKYMELRKELDRRGVPDLPHDTRWMDGEHVHVGVKGMNVTINVDGSKDPNKTAQIIGNHLREVARRSIQSQQGSFA
jgi:hypothetical protein